MKKIAEKANLAVPDLDITYEERVAQWHEQYVPQSGEIEPQAEPKPLTRGEIKWVLSLPNYKKLMNYYRYGLKKLNTEQKHNFDILTRYVQTVEAIGEDEMGVPHEQMLIDRTKQILGQPKAENMILGASDLGEIDLLYMDNEIAIVVECKRVIGREPKHAIKVKQQAIKYANVISVLCPELTVYGVTCTEYGFTIVECCGEPRFPARYEEFLDNTPIAFS